MFIANLYFGNGCRIAAGGETHAGFAIRADIRQGCPPSPLLFSFCGDLLIRRLLQALPTYLLRAYADDLGFVLADVRRSMPPLGRAFKVVSRNIVLSLKLEKCR